VITLLAGARLFVLKSGRWHGAVVVLLSLVFVCVCVLTYVHIIKLLQSSEPTFALTKPQPARFGGRAAGAALNLEARKETRRSPW
jgi:hypothetical protein